MPVGAVTSRPTARVSSAAGGAEARRAPRPRVLVQHGREVFELVLDEVPEEAGTFCVRAAEGAHQGASLQHVSGKKLRLLRVEWLEAPA